MAAAAVVHTTAMLFCLPGDAFALAHGVALHPDRIGIIDDPVADGIGQLWVVSIFMPAGHIELRAKNDRRNLASGFYQFQHVPRLIFFERIQHPLVENPAG